MNLPSLGIDIAKVKFNVCLLQLTGKLADLVVLGRNPLDNIRNSDSIRNVMINGVLYETDNMNEVYPDAKPRKKFFWSVRFTKGN